jgi:hypothetical protein
MRYEVGVTPRARDGVGAGAYSRGNDHIMREDQMSWREGKWLRTIHVVSEVSGKLDADQHELIAARDALQGRLRHDPAQLCRLRRQRGATAARALARGVGYK